MPRNDPIDLIVFPGESVTTRFQQVGRVVFTEYDAGCDVRASLDTWLMTCAQDGATWPKEQGYFVIQGVRSVGLGFDQKAPAPEEWARQRPNRHVRRATEARMRKAR
jgi:hypothetical protein